ncbi:hypothetical protein NDU88_007782, partial [Pleurodeles waltl]
VENWPPIEATGSHPQTRSLFVCQELKIMLVWTSVVLLLHAGYLRGDIAFHGPVFIREPNNIVFPVGNEDRKVVLNCEARGTPVPQ